MFLKYLIKLQKEIIKIVAWNIIEKYTISLSNEKLNLMVSFSNKQKLIELFLCNKKLIMLFSVKNNPMEFHFKIDFYIKNLNQD